MNCMGPTAWSYWLLPSYCAVVGVLDEREAVAVERGAQDLGGRGAVRVDLAAAGLARLDLADGGEELPGQVAAGLGLGEFGLGLLVGVEDGRGDAGLGLAHRDRGPYGRRLAVARARVGAAQGREVRVVRRVSGGAVVGAPVGRRLAGGGGLSLPVTAGAWDADSAATAAAATAVVAAPLRSRLPKCAVME
jgi:hypothetical protein